MYNTHNGRKCVWTARRRCPAGANRQSGAGESIYDVRFINNVRIAQNFSNRQRMQGLLYNHQHDECLLS